MSRRSAGAPSPGTPLPERGTAWPQLRERMLELAAGDIAWRDGRATLYVFPVGVEVERVRKEAYALFESENGLAPLAFPSLRRMEDEVIAIALDQLRAPAGACGTMTSGGSESLILAVKTARDAARSAGRLGSREQGRIVIPESGHPAFEKAAHLMDLEVVRAPLAADYGVDVAAMAAAIDQRTFLIAGSAPCFPFGVIDPVAELSELALERGVWLHVDACVGGFFAPFARRLGVAVPDFDFVLPGVSSLSGDLHKYGYGSKGASTLLVRTAELYRHVRFEVDAWNGGRMTTPTLAGTRPGGAIAAAWAVLHYLGIEGYLERQAMVLEARRRIASGLLARGCEILGDSRLGLLAYRTPGVDPAAVWQGLREQGWLNALNTKPPSIHLMLSPKHLDVVDGYLGALDTAIERARSGATGAGVEESRYA